MKQYALLIAVLMLAIFPSDGWAPPPSGGGGLGIPIRNLQDLVDVTKPLSPANGEGIFYSDTAGKYVSEAPPGGPDNLGDHTATETIQMDGNDLAEAGAYGGNAYMGSYYGNDIITKGPWVDVRAYGADPAYTSTVNAIAIQAALDAAGDAGGGVVLIPIGEFTSTRLEIPSYVTLTGMGAGSILKLADDANDRFITQEGWPSTAATDISVQNLTINGNNRNQSSTGPSAGQGNAGALDFSNVTGLTVRDVVIEDPHSTGINTMFSSNILIIGNIVRRAADDGIGINEDSSNVVVSGNTIENTAQYEQNGGSNSIEVQDGSFNVVIDANVVSFVGYTPVAGVNGININTHAGELGNYNITISNNVLYSETDVVGNLINITSVASSLASRIVVIGNALQGSDGTDGILIQNVTDVSVVNNSISGLIGDVMLASIEIAGTVNRGLIQGNIVSAIAAVVFGGGGSGSFDNLRISDNILFFTYQGFTLQQGTGTYNDISITNNELIKEASGSDWDFYFPDPDTNTYTTKIEVANNRLTGALRYFPVATDLSGFDFYNNIISDVRTTPERYYDPQSSECTTTEGTVCYDDGTGWSGGSAGLYVYDGAEWDALAPEPYYGVMFATDITTVINTADTFVPVIGYETIDAEVGVALNGTSGTMTFDASAAGVYDVDATMSFSAATSNNIHCEFAIDGVQTENGSFERAMGTGNDLGAGSMLGQLTLAAGEVLTVTCANDAATNIDIGHITFRANRISP